MMKHLQLWQIWTRGWGPRSWWHFVRREGFAQFVAWHLPHQVALWAFIRVYANSTDGAPGDDYQRAYEAWERRREAHP